MQIFNKILYYKNPIIISTIGFLLTYDFLFSSIWYFPYLLGVIVVFSLNTQFLNIKDNHQKIGLCLLLLSVILKALFLYKKPELDITVYPAVIGIKSLNNDNYLNTEVINTFKSKLPELLKKQLNELSKKNNLTEQEVKITSFKNDFLYDFLNKYQNLNLEGLWQYSKIANLSEGIPAIIAIKVINGKDAMLWRYDYSMLYNHKTKKFETYNQSVGYILKEQHGNTIFLTQYAKNDKYSFYIEVFKYNNYVALLFLLACIFLSLYKIINFKLYKNDCEKLTINVISFILCTVTLLIVDADYSFRNRCFNNNLTHLSDFLFNFKNSAELYKNLLWFILIKLTYPVFKLSAALPITCATVFCAQVFKLLKDLIKEKEALYLAFAIFIGTSSLIDYGMGKEIIKFWYNDLNSLFLAAPLLIYSIRCFLNDKKSLSIIYAILSVLSSIASIGFIVPLIVLQIFKNNALKALSIAFASLVLVAVFKFNNLFDLYFIKSLYQIKAGTIIMFLLNIIIIFNFNKNKKIQRLSVFCVFCILFSYNNMFNQIHLANSLCLINVLCFMQEIINFIKKSFERYTIKINRY